MRAPTTVEYHLSVVPSSYNNLSIQLRETNETSMIYTHQFNLNYSQKALYIQLLRFDTKLVTLLYTISSKKMLTRGC